MGLSDPTRTGSSISGMAIKRVNLPARGGPLARVNELNNHCQPIADGLCSSGTQVNITVITVLINTPSKIPKTTTYAARTA